MEKIESFKEVLEHLSQGEIARLANGNYFYVRKDNIVSYYRGNRIVMKIEDFVDLYQKNDFYLYEDNSTVIDPLKDEEYYSFKHK